MDNNLPQRKPNRLKNFDYSTNGMYFVTVCTKNKEKMFWDDQNNDNIANQYDNAVVGADIIRPHDALPLNCYGKIADIAIKNITKFYNSVKVKIMLLCQIIFTF